MLAQPDEYRLKRLFAQWTSRVESVSDIEVPSPYRVEHERWGLPGHVGDEHRRCRAQFDRPPCPAMLRYVTILGTYALCPRQEFADRLAFLLIKLVEGNRQVHNLFQAGRREEFGPGGQKLSPLGDSGALKAAWDVPGLVTGDPRFICASHLSAVRTENLSKLDEARWYFLVLAREDRPPLGLRHLFPINRTALIERCEVLQTMDCAHVKVCGPMSDMETGHRAGCERVSKRLRFRVDDMHGGAAQTIREHVAQRRSIVHVEPFGRCDKRAVVAVPGNFARA